MKKIIGVIIAAIVLVIGVYFMIDFYNTDESLYVDANSIGINNYSREDFYTEYKDLVIANENKDSDDGTGANGDSQTILDNSVINSNSGSSGGNVVSQQEAAVAIIKAMQAAGYNTYAICGALGNISHESSYDPRTTQSHKKDGASNEEIKEWIGSSGKALGLVQWDSSRAKALVNAAVSQNVQWYDLNFQVSYLISDMPSQGCPVDKFNSAITASDTSTKIEQGVFYFVQKFERCATKKNSPKKYSSQLTYEQRMYTLGWEERLQGGKDAYETYKSYFKE